MEDGVGFMTRFTRKRLVQKNRCLELLDLQNVK